jgi:hypothetical protein
VNELGRALTHALGMYQQPLPTCHKLTWARPGCTDGSSEDALHEWEGGTALQAESYSRHVKGGVGSSDT